MRKATPIDRLITLGEQLDSKPCRALKVAIDAMRLSLAEFNDPTQDGPETSAKMHLHLCDALTKIERIAREFRP